MAKKSYPVYVVLFNNNTPAGKIIKKVTNQEYSHAAISLDASLNKMYSFGTVPFNKGIEQDSFVVESIYSPEYESNIYFDVYVVFVTKEKYEKLKENIKTFEENQEQFYYSNKGLVEYFFGMKNTKNLTDIQRKKKTHWFCSEFVAYMLKTADERVAKNIMLSPGDLVEEPHIHHVSRYKISNYDSKDLDKKVKVIESKVSSLEDKILTESSVTSISSLVTPDKKVKIYRRDENEYVPIYVILTRNNTAMGNAIATLSRADYNHSSISLSADLTHMYSFAGNDKKTGGFIREDITTGKFHSLVHDKKMPSRYALYVTFVSKEKYDLIKAKLDNIIVDVDKYTYNFKQLLKLPFGLTSEAENSYICSEFVGMLLATANPKLINKHQSLLKPSDLVNHEKFHFVSSGELRNYKRSHTLREVNKIVKGKRLYQLLSESTDAANYLYYKNIIASEPLVNKMLDMFYPTTSLEPLPLFTCANGGLFFTDEDILQYDKKSELFYDCGKNIYGADLSEDVDHVNYCLNLYNVYMMIFIREDGLDVLKNGVYQKNGNSMSQYVFDILEQWEGRVKNAIEDLRKNIDSSEEVVNKCKQKLVDLMWSTKCRMDEELIPSYKYNFALKLGLILLPAFDEMIDIDKLKINFGYVTKVAHDIFLTSDGRYPVFDQNSLIAAAHEYSEDEIDSDHFFEKWLHFYKLLGCKFKLSDHNAFARNVPDRSVIDDYDYRMSILP